MREFSSASSSEIVKPTTLETGSFDPDKRVDVNRQIDRGYSEGYDVDKRLDFNSIQSTATDSNFSDIGKSDIINALRDDKNEDNTQEVYQKEINGKMHYYDDNGKLYRIDNNLQPNSEYDINGYHYTTDEEGRIISAEGKLHLTERDKRLNIKDSIEDIGKGDQLSGDDRGHLIGDQFDGSNGLENIVPQNADINRNSFRTFENELAKEVKFGSEVYCKVEPIYDGDSRRPSDLVVSYAINGVEGTRIFSNNSKG